MESANKAQTVMPKRISREGTSTPSDDRSRVSVRDLKSKYGPWRAGVLISVYVLMIVHVIHWKLAGKTLAPMEVNEVMVALERGVITAGAILFAVLLVGTVLFGRFFCSWACHIMALQDLCGWILRKLKIRPRIVRSRLLAWVPPGAAFYMFIWPQIWRAVQGRAFPELTTRLTAGQGFWRNLPGPGIAILTFLICGFIIVYVVGSRGFCNYVCPYGVLFGLLDRVTLGRIRVNDRCQQCGTCTGFCKSGVRVHEEVANYGMVVSPKCMKDLDCVSVCPQNALSYGFARPSLLKGRPRGDVKKRSYDFTLPEDIWMLTVFVGSFFAYRGLYDALPFLMSLALGVITGYLSVVVMRLFYRADLRFAHYQLKLGGCMTSSGWAVGGVASFLLILTVHSGFIQYHQRLGYYWFDRTVVPTASLYEQRRRDPGETEQAEGAIERSLHHLQICKRWGLVDTIRLNAKLAWLYLLKNDPVQAEHFFRVARDKNPDQAIAHASLGMVLVRQGRGEQALAEYARAVQLQPDYPQAQLSLAILLQEAGRFDEAIQHCRAVAESHPGFAGAHNELGSALMNKGLFEDARQAFMEALEENPDLAEAHYNVGLCLFRMEHLPEAVEHYQAALRLKPTDAEAHNNLGFTLAKMGRMDEAVSCYEQAVRLSSDFAEPHLNLARVYAGQQRYEEANAHLRQALRINPRLAELLQQPVSAESPQ